MKTLVLVVLVIAAVGIYKRRKAADHRPATPPGGANPNLQTWGRLW